MGPGGAEQGAECVLLGVPGHPAASGSARADVQCETAVPAGQRVVCRVGTLDPPRCYVWRLDPCLYHPSAARSESGERKEICPVAPFVTLKSFRYTFFWLDWTFLGIYIQDNK